MQFLSEKLSRHLTSLAPGFEGHYGYYKFYDDSESVACHEEIWWIEKHREFTQVRRKKPELICPAWQAEDVLRNWIQISDAKKLKHIWGYAEIISRLLYATDHGNPYQKIEEYLWSVLK